MAYDEELAERIRALVAGEPGLTEQKMFGGLAFLVGGHMAVAASGQGGILVRVDPVATSDGEGPREHAGVGERHQRDGAAAASRDTRQAIRATVAEFPEVQSIVRFLTMQLGSDSVLVNGELELRRDLTTPQIEALIERIDNRLRETVPEVSDTFWELHHRPATDEALDLAATSIAGE